MAEPENPTTDDTRPDTELADAGEVQQEQTPPAGEQAASGEGEDLKAVREELAAAQSQIADLNDQMLRARAEVENIRRRMERDVEKAHKFALESFSQELLAVLDSLELGLAAGRGDNASLEKLIEGTDLTLKMFKSVLDKFNVKEVDPVGQVFDPELHQAMTMQASAEHEPNTVMTVFQKGYTLNDRLIRPARVVVATAPAEDSDQEKDAAESGETA